MADRLAEGNSLISITRGIFEGTFGKAGTACGVDQPLHFEVVHYVEEAHAFFTNPIAFVNFNVVEVDFAGA
ncbi:hypothetical protein D3C73_1224400 [compost metagenome]